MACAYISLGSNIDPETHLQAAARELRHCGSAFTASSVYQGPAVGFDGADFLNAVVSFDTDLTVHQLVERLREIEDAQLRDRSQPRFASRTLDLDLLLFDDLISHTETLELPRGEILRASFVLQPLAEIAGDLRHPETGQRYRSHWQQMQANNPQATLIRTALVL